MYASSGISTVIKKLVRNLGEGEFSKGGGIEYSDINGELGILEQQGLKGRLNGRVSEEVWVEIIKSKGIFKISDKILLLLDLFTIHTYGTYIRKV